ncbi:MAG: fatty acid desaturase [Pseudomonadota bacterium]
MNIKGSEFREDVRRQHPLPPEVLRRLTTLDDSRAWVSVAWNALALVVVIGLGLWFWTLPPVVAVGAVAALLLPIALVQQACFVIAHDAAHYRLFKARWLNEFVGRAFATVVGIPMRSYRVVHRLHHNDLYGETDPDTPIHGGYPRGRLYLLKKLARDLTGSTARKTYGYFFGNPVINDDLGTRARPLDDTAPALREAARADRWWVAAFHVLLPLIAWYTGWLTEYLVLWILPLVTVLQAVLRFRAILEHGAVNDFRSPLTAARTNLGPAWLMNSLFPHNVHYHVEHHLYPAIPHYHLPACHAELAARGWLDEAEVCDVFDTMRRVFADPVSTRAATA